MGTLYLILYILAGIFFGLSAGRVSHRLDFLALGLMCWVVVDIIQAIQKL